MTASLIEMHRWLVGQALPKWAGAGFDPAFGGFRERLDLTGAPVPGVAHRLVTQARQIYVYSHASLLGWHRDGAALAQQAVETLMRRYKSPDGKPGYVFSVDPTDTHVVDDRRDAYGHAFLLYALSWWYRVTKDTRLVDEADRVIAFFATQFLTMPSGGIARETHSPWRLQNPHMHYFEAMIAWHEATGEARFLAQADAMFDLFATRFWQPGSQTLSEYFDDTWAPAPGERGQIYEPGHHFEWAWLLRKYARFTGRSTAPFVDGLYRTGLLGRLRDGRLADEALPGASGNAHPHKTSTRLWPLTEWAKSAAVEYEGGNAGARNDALAAFDCLQTNFCRPEYAGGWIDHIDIDRRPLVDFMPATSLYHLFLAVAEASRVFKI